MKNEINNNDLPFGTFLTPPSIRIESEEYIRPSFFNKGDIVKVEKLPNAPLMLVEEVVFEKTKSGEIKLDEQGNRILIGIKCGWFGLDSEYREKVWNSKDIILMRAAEKKRVYSI